MSNESNNLAIPFQSSEEENESLSSSSISVNENTINYKKEINIIPNFQKLENPLEINFKSQYMKVIILNYINREHH